MSKLNSILPEDWAKFFADKEEEIFAIGKKLGHRRTEREIFPKREEVFRAFQETRLNDVRVVWLGQDPYPNKYQGEPVACGLAFATRNNAYCPPSLRVLNKAIYEDLKIESDGGIDWFNLPQQGVLLLNTSLTVEESMPNSHSKLWESFTLFVIQRLQYENTGLIFVLLGKESQKYIPAINTVFHHVIKRSHPVSSVYKGEKWDHQNLWSEINKIVYSQNGETIQWVK